MFHTSGWSTSTLHLVQWLKIFWIVSVLEIENSWWFYPIDLHAPRSWQDFLCLKYILQLKVSILSSSSIFKIISLEVHLMVPMQISPLKNILPLKFSIYILSAGNISALVSVMKITCYWHKLTKIKSGWVHLMVPDDSYSINCFPQFVFAIAGRNPLSIYLLADGDMCQVVATSRDRGGGGAGGGVYIVLGVYPYIPDSFD